jgi:hypothetical protein
MRNKAKRQITPDSRALCELLAECVDILDAPAYGPSVEPIHLTLLEQAIASGEAADDEDVLQCLYLALRSLTFAQRTHFGTTIRLRQANRLPGDLRAMLNHYRFPSFLYHGTIFGNLSEIRRDGLSPGANAVWKRSAVLRGLGDNFVFLTDTWRGAVFWAEAASKTRRATDTRPVVIRIPRAGLSAEPDPSGILPGCFMVPSEVAVTQAEVFLGPLKGYPSWKPLAQVVPVAEF